MAVSFDAAIFLCPLARISPGGCRPALRSMMLPSPGWSASARRMSPRRWCSAKAWAAVGLNSGL